MMKGHSILLFLFATVIFADATLNVCYKFRNTSLRNNDDPSPDSQPYYYNRTDFDIDQFDIKLTGELTNISIWMDDPITSWDSDHLFIVEYPNLTILANYDLSGNIGDLFDVYGDGDCVIHLYNFSVSVSILSVYLNQSTFCSSIKIDVDVQETPMIFHNLMDGAELQDLFNKAIVTITPEIVKFVWTEQEPFLEQAVNDYINGKKKLLPPFENILNEFIAKVSMTNI